MRVFVAGKLVQRSWQDDAGNKRHSVEIQVTHVGPDLQFATAEVTKSSADGSPALRRPPGKNSSSGTFGARLWPGSARVFEILDACAKAIHRKSRSRSIGM
jgi:single-strand DNA-binding protein